MPLNGWQPQSENRGRVTPRGSIGHSEHITRTAAAGVSTDACGCEAAIAAWVLETQNTFQNPCDNSRYQI
ncbi:MAG: hypothetical protein PUP91_38135 [Rhizonema sp. PD37]|nr:hypothetical protein [Rhizonema sp. PD37]